MAEYVIHYIFNLHRTSHLPTHPSTHSPTCPSTPEPQISKYVYGNHHEWLTTRTQIKLDQTHQIEPVWQIDLKQNSKYEHLAKLRRTLKIEHNDYISRPRHTNQPFTDIHHLGGGGGINNLRWRSMWYIIFQPALALTELIHTLICFFARTKS